MEYQLSVAQKQLQRRHHGRGCQHKLRHHYTTDFDTTVVVVTGFSGGRAVDISEAGTQAGGVVVGSTTYQYEGTLSPLQYPEYTPKHMLITNTHKRTIYVMGRLRGSCPPISIEEHITRYLSIYSDFDG